MSYNNLIYLLVVIFLVSFRVIPEEVALAGWQAGLLFVGKFALFHFLCRYLYSPRWVSDVRTYLKAEKHLSFVALFFLAIDIYLLDCLYYFSLLPYATALPIIGRFLGLLLFVAYLIVIWLSASSRNGVIFGRATETRYFVKENIRSNLPIVLPWLLISLLLDVINILPFPAAKGFMDSEFGEIVVLLVFVCFIALIFPPLLMRVWGCRPMPASNIRDHMTSFCQRMNLHYREIMIWPLFGGQMLTAGVVGFIGRFRYIMVTPGLLDNLNSEEVDAVLAHEIGHVKRYHMPLYLLVLAGFTVMVNPLIELFLYSVVQRDWFYRLAEQSNVSLAGFLDIFLPMTMLVLLVVFLRVVFGFFMRNFERQADLHALTSLGGGAAISAALEKVALLSGNIRDLPSWHHFGISERVDFMAACDDDPRLVERHHRKVYLALGFYCLLIVAAGVLNFTLPEDLVEQGIAERVVGKLQVEVERDPNNYQIHWALGDIHYRRKAYGDAISSYRQSLALVPENAEVLNNLAWLLLTCEDAKFIDVDQGFVLASKAVVLKPSSHILDTLANAYWLMGEKKMAVETEKRALVSARPGDKKIYVEQLKTWQAEEKNPGALFPEF